MAKTLRIKDRFVMDTDNGKGAEFLHRINDDGTRSIALLSDIESFVSDLEAECERLRRAFILELDSEVE